MSLWNWIFEPRFDTVALSVLESKKNRSPSTQISAKIHIERLIEYFGALRLSKITEATWANYIFLESQKRHRKFFDDRKYMRMILLYAQRQGHVRNLIRLAIPDAPWNAGRELSRAELRRLFRYAGPGLRFQMEIALKMGLRLREMLRLRWDQFNWKRELVTFLPTDTKTRRGRQVPIPPSLIPKFRARRAAGGLYVFPSEKVPNRPSNSNRTAWRRIKRKARVKCRWHDLRHTCATEMLRRGVTREVAARYLGMSSRILDRIYLHLNTEDLRKAVRTV